MANRPVPTLSSIGWKNEIRDKIDTLMSYFFYSDYSQSNVYLGNITSLPKIIEEHGNNELNIKTEMEYKLQTYLGRYFDAVEIDVKVNIPEDSVDNRMEIVCSALVAEKGVKYDISRLLRLKDGKLNEIIDRNNRGVQDEWELYR